MLQSVNDNLEDRMSDIRGLAEFTGETLKDIRNVHEVMDNKFHVITGTVGTTLEQIKTVGEELGRTTEYVDDVTERAIERFDRVGDRIRERVKILTARPTGQHKLRLSWLPKSRKIRIIC